jgi:hypothetical protein
MPIQVKDYAIYIVNGCIQFYEDSEYERNYYINCKDKSIEEIKQIILEFKNCQKGIEIFSFFKKHKAEFLF